MHTVRKIADFIFSLRMLAVLAFLLLAIVIWFLGPLLSFGGMLPLGSITTRISAIAMLLALLSLWLVKFPISVVGIAAICLLIWHAGPLLAFGNIQLLETAMIRAVIIALLVISFIFYSVWKFVKKLTSDKDFYLRFFPDPTVKEGEEEVAPDSRERIRAVSATVIKAVQQLRQMRPSAGLLRQLVEGKRYLYELPWYLLIGSPGTGKTTAILNSGQKFPLAEQMAAQAPSSELGTFNCDWWFTNESVLIDTAGRYAQQNEEAAELSAAEWRGFLRQLCKCRPRAPINGALLITSVAELLQKTPEQRTDLAAAMRSRLAELRTHLRIRFPVYVVVTKLDLLPGFVDYFKSLTIEERQQVWGFTVPYREETIAIKQESLRSYCAQELRLLEQRLDDGMDSRLQEEYDNQCRKRMYALPQEFRSLSGMLESWLQQVFLDSRYDDTQLYTTLRGVYFTSAAQAEHPLAIDRSTVFQRFWHGLTDHHTQAPNGSTLPSTTRSFFLQNLFQKLIVSEAHLVRPNLRWELRFRLMRIGGHVMAVLSFVWLGFALMTSFVNNQDYLIAIDAKVKKLAAQVAAFRKAPDSTAIPDVLSATRDLPRYATINLGSPGGDYRYGLYAAPAIMHASHTIYTQLQQQFLLPQIIKRVDSALAENIAAKDADATYKTLLVYLMLFDQERFKSEVVKEWILRDWENTESAAVLGGRKAVVPHLDALFVDEKWVKPTIPQNHNLVQRARAFLDDHPTSIRLYERAKAVLAKEAPDNFTLSKVIGSSAGTVLAVAGDTLASGVPGLYTYEGYHEIFNKRLPEFVAQAQTEDVWVMGRRSGVRLTSLVNVTVPVAARDAWYKSDIAKDIRKQYLKDYTRYWTDFLNSVYPVSGPSDLAGSSLALDVQTLRALAAPDSPLVRLVRAAVHETSLSVTKKDSEETSLTDMALSALEKTPRTARTANKIGKAIDLHSSTKLEKELVDSHFSALREVVTGQVDNGSRSTSFGKAVTAVSTAKGLVLDTIMGLLNEQYTFLVAADNALANNSMPPVMDVAFKLRMEATKLPAPIRAVLAGVSDRTNDKINQAVGKLLATQMEASIGNVCRSAIEGKYPFADSNQEVNIEDFVRIFAAGGLLDTFFQKTLARHVDTDSKPWRYKMALPGSPVFQGPSLEPFQHADAIRDVFFREQGAKRMSWKMDVKVASMDPEITRLAIDIDGQSIRYAHGPVTSTTVVWPGMRGGAVAEITASPQVRPDTSTMLANGPWALFRLLERGRIIQTASASRLAVDYIFDGRHVQLDVTTGSMLNPLTTNLLKDFRCPIGVI